MTFNAKTLRLIATEVRKELELLVLSAPNNFIFSAGSQSHDLEGYCMYGSIMVWQALKERGFNPRIVVNDYHFFTVVTQDDRRNPVYLVDVTASQFGQADVCVRKMNHHLDEQFPSLLPPLWTRDWGPPGKEKFWRVQNEFYTPNNYDLKMWAREIELARVVMKRRVNNNR